MMEIRKISVDQLLPADYNPRKDLRPGDPEFEKLKRSVQEFGYVEPIIWNQRTGIVVGGHQRLKVLQHLGYTEVDCVVLDIDEQKEKTLNVALNKISGDWDMPLLTALLKDLDESGFDATLTGFDVSEMSDMFDDQSEIKEDEPPAVAAPEQEPFTKPGDRWLLGQHVLYCGDSTKAEDMAALMEGTKAYLEQLKADNPENTYRYYNENYYIQTITEGERKAVLDQMKDPSVFFADAFESDYPGLFIKAELNKGMDELTMHLNRAAFESNFFTSFAVLIIGAAYLDSVQAYNLVSPENRGSRLVCVDENGAVLMDSDEMEGSEEAAAEESAIANVDYTLSDHVVVDNENFTFTIKSIEAKGDWGFTLKVFCENKTDKNLMFSWDKVSVMGFMADPFWGSEIAAGKKANEEISFSYSMLEEIGIDAIDDITFTLRVSDSEDWAADPLLVEEFAIYPTGKSIQEISYPSRKTTDGEKVLYDTADYTVIILSSEANGGDFLLHYYLENKTGHEITFSMDDVSVNGYMADPFWADSVAAGKKAYVTVCFYESTLAENDISTVEEIEFTLRVSNAENWDTHATEVFTYNP